LSSSVVATMALQLRYPSEIRPWPRSFSMASHRVACNPHRVSRIALAAILPWVAVHRRRHPFPLAFSTPAEQLPTVPQRVRCSKALCGARGASRQKSYKLVGHKFAERSLLGSEGGKAPSRDTLLLNASTAPLLLTVLAMLYGGNMPLLKSLQSSGMSPVSSLILRFVMASLVALPVLMQHGRRARHVVLPACELAVYMSLAFTLQIMALGKVAASTCSIALACQGVVVQLLELLFDRKRVAPAVGFGSIGTLVGIALFNLGAGGAVAGSPAVPGGIPGEVLAILSTMLLALQVWRSSKMQPSDEHGSSDGLTSALAAAQCLLTLLFCTSLQMMAGTISPHSLLAMASAMTSRAWMQAAACGILCTGLPLHLEISAFQLVPASMSSLIYATTPVWGLVFAVLFLGEPCRLTSCAAGLLILACAIGPSLLQARRECAATSAMRSGGFATATTRIAATHPSYALVPELA